MKGNINIFNKAGVVTTIIFLIISAFIPVVISQPDETIKNELMQYPDVHLSAFPQLEAKAVHHPRIA